MPTTKTEASELAVAFGILDMDPTKSYAAEELERRFEGTLSADKHSRFLAEYQKDPQLYGRLHGVGRMLAKGHTPFAQAASVQWTGPYHQASTASGAKDLLVANTPVSVKTESNVVANLSPTNMMVNLPQGKAPATREENWYLKTEPAKLQGLYTFVHSLSEELRRLPADVRTFEAQATHDNRKRIQAVLKASPAATLAEFDRLYQELCRSVAERSADMFNRNLSGSLATSSRRSVFENLARWFFRLNAVRYVLCGIDHGEDFAVVVPDLTNWLREWALESVEASPDLTRGQSVVDFVVTARRKADRLELEAHFHSELRWSHGRFSGAVESKLYKEFPWKSLPFLARI
jgi:hypothetical protein